MISGDGVRGDWTRRLREHGWGLLRVREKTHSSFSVSFRYLVGQSLIHALSSPCRYLRGLAPLLISSLFSFLFFLVMIGGVLERDRVCVLGLMQRETRLGLSFLEVLQRTHALLVVTVADHDHSFHFLPDLDDDLGPGRE